MARPPVLLLLAGAPGPAVRSRHRSFDAWFGDLLAPVASVEVADATAGPPRDPGRFAGLVVTGSYASVTRPEPWMETLSACLLAAARSAAVLGVCFGHQLLARALGGRVERNPRGVEAGTAVVELTGAGRADPLFAGLPAALPVQQLHEDHVPEPPPGSILLAANAAAPVQAFAAGPRIRCVQFHPEFDETRMRAMCDEERAWLEAAGPGVAEQAIASLRPTPEAERVIANWVDAYART